MFNIDRRTITHSTELLSFSLCLYNQENFLYRPIGIPNQPMHTFEYLGKQIPMEK